MEPDTKEVVDAEVVEEAEGAQLPPNPEMLATLSSDGACSFNSATNF